MQLFTAFVLSLAGACSRFAIARSSDKLPVTIPIVVADNLIYMHGRVNDSRPLSVTLTRARRSALSHLQSPKKLVCILLALLKQLAWGIVAAKLCSSSKAFVCD